MRLLGLKVPERTVPQAQEERAINYGSFGFSTEHGFDLLASDSRSGFDSLPVVYGCIRLIATRLSSLPLRVLDDHEREVPSPLWMLRPNAYCTSRDMITGMVWSLLIDGSAFLLPLYGDSGRLEGITVPHPKQVHLWCNAAGEIVYSVLGQEWEDQIVHAKYLALPSSLRGTGPIEAARLAIESGKASQTFVRDSFTRAATMNYALIAKDPMDKVEKRALAAQIKAQHHGARNSYLPLVLDSEIAIKPLSITAEQAQFLQLSTWTAATIAGQLFGIDPSLLGIMQSGSSLTYSNAQDRERNLWTDVLQPLARIIEESLTQFLPEGQKADLNERELLLGGPRDRAAIARSMSAINASAGEAEHIFSRDELRAVLGYQPDA